MAPSPSVGNRPSHRPGVVDRPLDHLLHRFLHDNPVPRVAADHRVRRLLDVPDLLRVHHERLAVQPCETDHATPPPGYRTTPTSAPASRSHDQFDRVRPDGADVPPALWWNWKR